MTRINLLTKVLPTLMVVALFGVCGIEATGAYNDDLKVRAEMAQRSESKEETEIKIIEASKVSEQKRIQWEAKKKAKEEAERNAKEEAERLAREEAEKKAAEQARQQEIAASPSQQTTVPAPQPQPVVSGPKTVNFDSVFPFVDCRQIWDLGTRQSYLDQNYIIFDYNDYFHHNTSQFTSLFYSINPGDTVVIGGCTYTADYLEYGNITADDKCLFGSSSGEDIIVNGTVEIVTCTGAPGTSGRAVMHLK